MWCPAYHRPAADIHTAQDVAGPPEEKAHLIPDAQGSTAQVRIPFHHGFNEHKIIITIILDHELLVLTSTMHLNHQILKRLLSSTCKCPTI